MLEEREDRGQKNGREDEGAEEQGQVSDLFLWDQTELRTALQYGPHTKSQERERQRARDRPQHDPSYVIYAALLVLLAPGLPEPYPVHVTLT